jgi:hypothetical protein
MSNNLFVNNLVATTAVQGSPVIPKIYLQMSPSFLYCPVAGNATLNTIRWSTTFQAYSSGNWVPSDTNGRISVPVSGLYSINLWGCPTSGGGVPYAWLGIVFNGTQATENIQLQNATGSVRTIAGYQPIGTGGISVSWTGYISTSDYFYGYINSSNPTLVTNYPCGISITFLRYTNP